MNIRQKLTVFTIGALVLVQVLVGALFAYLHSQHLSEQAYASISNAFVALDDEMMSLNHRLASNATTLAGRKDFISSVSMISAYQDVVNYRPLVFDVEKTLLSRELLKAVRAAQVDLISVYTPENELIAFAGRLPSGDYISGIRSYEDGQPVLKTEFPGGQGASAESELPTILDALPYQSHLETGGTDYHQWAFGLYVEAAEKIKRPYPDGSFQEIGSIWVREQLDEEFASAISRKSGIQFSFIIPNGINIGNMTGQSLIRYTEDLSVSAPDTNEPGHFVRAENLDFFLGYKFLQLVNGEGVLMLFGAPKSVLWGGVRDFLIATFFVLAGSSLLIIPVMMMFMNKTLNEPLATLISGVDSLREGKFKRIPSISSHDEIRDLADSYNTMVEAIEQREDALLLAKEEAEIANHTKSMFLANMSHELRTPLNAINGFSELMTERTFGDIPKPYDEYAKLINESGLHLLHIISDILDMTKVEVGKFELNEESFEPSTIINEAIKLTMTDATLNKVSVETNLEGNCVLYADPLRFKQCLLNLLSNAYKFSSGGRVMVRSEAQPDGMYVLAIADNGVGMTPEQVQRALEPFTQVGSGVDPRIHLSQGTGLGLTLTSSLVKLHGGTLTIASEPGVGTTVTITFPKSRCQPIASSPQNDAAN